MLSSLEAGGAATGQAQPEIPPSRPGTGFGFPVLSFQSKVWTLVCQSLCSGGLDRSGSGTIVGGRLNIASATSKELSLAVGTSIWTMRTSHPRFVKAPTGRLLLE